MFNPSDYPEFVKNLPEADLPIENLQGWLQKGPNGLMLFLISHETVELPHHSHGDQWGMVVRGSLELTIGEETKLLSPGDSYFIPSGTMHGGTLHKGLRVIDFFDDPDRYQSK